MTNLYDPNFVAKYFDDFGEREWTRLVNTPADEIKLHVESDAAVRTGPNGRA